MLLFIKISAISNLNGNMLIVQQWFQNNSECNYYNYHFAKVCINLPIVVWEGPEVIKNLALHANYKW
jgi:hypothetical protein